MNDEMKEQLRILKKYTGGCYLDDEDEAIVTTLCSVGWMNKGVDLRKMKITAKTTHIGEKIVL